ncbi:Receptor family ligand binding region [Streptomyces sp. YIM 130001]|uniref:ABC transporter substrate-binding protein n=1 Tax=Streptomyces sp. YIM 130001 TaxID=2259644 RepID=UPI000EBCAE56|nr:ABC transporter substrate-binding protein [Streptomyces sp. YIM 130001]RII14009.1 Receptor family ligand binding region [Streptomyces sp. YIM 130001]
MGVDFPKPFPLGAASDDFLRSFAAAVLPLRSQSLREEVCPGVLLETDGPPGEVSCRAVRVLDGLRAMLGSDADRRVSYAEGWPGVPVPAQGQGDAGCQLLDEFITSRLGAELRKGAPAGGDSLRVRNLELVEYMAAWAMAPPPGVRFEGRALRDHCYARRAEAGVLHTMEKWVGREQDGPADSLVGVLRTLLAEPVLRTLPRWCWSRWWSRRLLRSRHAWYARWRPTGHSGSVFDKAVELLRREAERLRGADAAEALRSLEELMFRALLADLHRARPGRFLPWRRRRRTRRVILLGLPPGDAPEAVAVRRLLAVYRSSLGAPGSASLLLAGAGRAADYAQPDWKLCRNLAEGAKRLEPVPVGSTAPAPLLVRMPDQQSFFATDGIYQTPVQPTWPLNWASARTEAAMEVVALTAAMSLIGPWLWPQIFPSEPGCLDGSAVAGQSRPAVMGESAGADGGSPRKQYAAVVQAIGKLNRQALRAESEFGKPVRKVVYFGSGIDNDPDEIVMNGTIPELRGIWLAQRRLNALAAEESGYRVRLYVDVRDAGRKFRNVVQEAGKVAEEAQRAEDLQNSRTVVGVIGFRESRAVTKKAAQVLTEHRIPIIGTTATAVAMQQAGDYYRPMSPDNDRETEIAARFADQGRIVSTGGGNCDTATQAVVVKDPGDLYTNELAEKFVRNFGPGRARTVSFPGRHGAQVSARDTALRVCDALRLEPRTVVYWASRVPQFTAFVNEYGPASGCAGRPLTVIGGNELTNAALGGQFPQSWLRLYHTVHVLPDGHPDENYQAKELVADYIREYTSRDPWVDDGHVALAYDALTVLSYAADGAYSSTREADAQAVKSKLDNGVHFEGASGAIDIPAHNGSRPPRDKALVILHHTDEKQKLVLYCGRFTQKDGTVTHWGPDDQYRCPQDED